MPRYCLAQINSTVGDLAGNAAAIVAAMRKALAYSPDLVIFPELALAGYPPEDLLLKPGFVAACREEFERLTRALCQLGDDGACPPAALVGYPRRADDGKLYNAAALIRNGGVEHIYHKNLLPNYSVFDEDRYFAKGDAGLVFELAGQQVGVVICEDAWDLSGPARAESRAGAQVVACLSASPYHRGKHLLRESTFAALCQKYGVWFLYANLVGGQDELIFDGGSLVMNPNGEVVARGAEFAEDLLVFDLPGLPPKTPGAPPRSGCSCGCQSGPCPGAGFACVTPAARKLDDLEEVYSALALGVRDYIRKNGFRGVIVGLSGGVDSALTAALAVDALGKEQVLGVTMPSRYSSGDTVGDAGILAANLGIRFLTLPIGNPHRVFAEELAPHFAGVDSDPENLTDQNLQARIRAVYLMALSNKLGLLVLNTSNKSESAVGYGTLYGDMIGGFAAIKDVFKTDVWLLARHVNRRHGREVIPVSTIDRVPSAELRPDQEDRQSLPDYPVLDPILRLYVEQDLTLPEIVASGQDEATARRVAELVDRSEFKRRQAVMGARVTPKAFGKDRRLPVTNRFRR